ncbi:hypothetical protein IE53DRAFT_20650 [Violaceomyces palustris]|uniref:Uncharacterized protein n=1 Tax=Violaceomyces palustris TaxID=1673888 RepID=A0ACD0P1V0_9BASI|nr:hypothetical protein IE53DRAFT_20650 [Violaceomyces palustris]
MKESSLVYFIVCYSGDVETVNVLRWRSKTGDEKLWELSSSDPCLRKATGKLDRADRL